MASFPWEKQWKVEKKVDNHSGGLFYVAKSRRMHSFEMICIWDQTGTSSPCSKYLQTHTHI